MYSLKKRFRSFSTVGTIDSEEVENFRKLGDEWWNPCGPLKPLHSMNKLRVPFVRDGLINEGCVASVNVGTATPLKGMSVLDVGCGGECLRRAVLGFLSALFRGHSCGASGTLRSLGDWPGCHRQRTGCS